MEIEITMLMLFVVLNCSTKISLWGWWQRFAFSAILAAVVWWSGRYAMLQSKTQMAELLRNVQILQNMAAVVTVESAVNFAFCMYRFGDASGKPKWWQRVLEWYPSLLVFPVMFYVLTQVMFMAIGVDFGITTVAVAAASFVLLPLVAEGMKRLVPDTDGRIETHLLLSCLVCVLGLISTVSNKMVYSAAENPVDWPMVGLAAAVFAALFAAGFAGSRLRWRLKRHSVK